MILTASDIQQIFREARWACITHARPGQMPRLEIYLNEAGDPICEVYAFPPRSSDDEAPIRIITIHTIRGKR